MIDRDDHPVVKCDRVVTDDVEVGRLATTHLIEQGRKAIAHILGPPITHAKRRADGYRAALKEHAVRCPRRMDRARRFHGSGRLPCDEEAARAQAACGRRVRGERSRRRSVR